MTAPQMLPITELLRRWREGDSDAANALLPMVYEQLRAIARCQLAGDRGQMSRVEHAEQKPTRLPVVAVIGRYSTRLREGFCGTRQRRQ